MFDMRLRVPELFEEHRTTAYAVAKGSSGRINYTTLYRLAKRRGRVKSFDAALMEALCDALDVTPGDLLERDRKKGR